MLNAQHRIIDTNGKLEEYGNDPAYELVSLMLAR